MPRRPPERKRVGRRSLLTEDRAQVILRAVEDGNHLTVACALGGIAYGTLWRWIEMADTCEEAIEKGLPHNPDHEVHVEFRDRLTRARALAESRMVSAVQRDAQGGALISEEPVMETLAGGASVVARGDDGEVLYKRTWTSPNGRTALAFLARSAPDRWGEKRVAVEPDEGDGPVDPLLGPAPAGVGAAAGVDKPGEGEEVVTDLFKRLELVARERRAGVDLVQDPAEEEMGADGAPIQDIEIVEDGNGG